jgi:hypothetical protein
MSPLSLFVTPLSIFLSLTTATGVVVHDTRIDKATLSVLSTPSMETNYQANTKLVNYATDSHTHVERHTLSTALHELRSDTPKVSPRSNEEKRYTAQKHLGFGNNPFENSYLPLS